jgi:hypothetical protein
VRAGIGRTSTERFLSWLPTSNWFLVALALAIFGAELAGVVSLLARQQYVRWAFLAGAAWLLALGIFKLVEWAPFWLWLCVATLATSCGLVFVVPLVARWTRGRWTYATGIPLGLATVALSLVSLGAADGFSSSGLSVVGAISGLVTAADGVRNLIPRVQREAAMRERTELEVWASEAAVRGARTVNEQLARLHAQGVIDAQGKLLVPRPSDMTPDSGTDV